MHQHLRKSILRRYVDINSTIFFLICGIIWLSSCTPDGASTSTRSHNSADFGAVDNHTIDTILHTAAGAGQAEIVSNILENGMSPDTKGKYGRTALHVAVSNCKSNTVELLLKYNANPNAIDDEGNTPLHLAARCGCITAAQLLIKNFANVDAQNKQGWTPLKIAVGAFHEETGKYLIQAGAKYDVGIASALGMLKEVNSFIVTHPDQLTHRGIGGWTPLHYAAAHGQTDVVRYLLEKGARIDATNTDGATPLSLAAANGYAKTVEYLVNHNASVQKKDNNGYYPIHKAVLSGSVQIIQLFLNSGANVNVPAEKGITPLHLAVDKGNTNVVAYLLEHGANVFTKDAYGATPLKWAEYREAYVIAEMLRAYSKQHSEFDR